MNQFDIKEELDNYTKENNMSNVPFWLKEALNAWMEAVELQLPEFTYYDDEKNKITKKTSFLSLDELIENEKIFTRFRDWFNDQIAKWVVKN